MSVILNNYKIMLCPHCCSVVAFDINEDITTYSKESYNWETFKTVYTTEEWAECPNCKAIVTISTETKSKSREELFSALKERKNNTENKSI